MKVGPQYMHSEKVILAGLETVKDSLQSGKCMYVTINEQITTPLSHLNIFTKCNTVLAVSSHHQKVKIPERDVLRSDI